MKSFKPSKLFERSRVRPLYSMREELAAVMGGDKAASFDWPLWKHPRRPAERYVPELRAVDRGLALAWRVFPSGFSEQIATTLPELWRVQAHAALWDAIEIAGLWDRGCEAVQSYLFGYTDEQTRAYLSRERPPNAVYFLVDARAVRHLRRVRGRYLDARDVTIFAPRYRAELRQDARRRVAPARLARAGITSSLWREHKLRSSPRLWMATLGADDFNAELVTRIEVLGAKGWRCD